MKEKDCILNAPIAITGSGDKFKRGSIIGPVSTMKNKTVVLVEWTRGAIDRVEIAKLISKEEADAKEAEAKAEEDRLRAGQAKLEHEFEVVFNKVHPEIQEKIAQAAKLIGEAEALSEKYGIPFRPDNRISGVKMSYIPSTLKQKWSKLYADDDYCEFVNDITGAHGGEYDGWQSSQVC